MPPEHASATAHLTYTTFCMSGAGSTTGSAQCTFKGLTVEDAIQHGASAGFDVVSAMTQAQGARGGSLFTKPVAL